MAIDPKKIEEWKARVERQAQNLKWPGYGYWEDEEWAFWGEPLAALLSEREEMQREILSLRAKVEAQAVLGAPVQFVPVDADPGWRVEALAVLRSVEWAPAVCDDCGVNSGPVCPLCMQGQNEGHAPDCRLSALLRGQP